MFASYLTPGAYSGKDGKWHRLVLENRIKSGGGLERATVRVWGACPP